MAIDEKNLIKQRERKPEDFATKDQEKREVKESEQGRESAESQSVSEDEKYKPVRKTRRSITDEKTVSKALEKGQEKTEQRRQIENILQEDLMDVYQKMDTQQKEIFKKEGEKAASKIEVLINDVKDKTREILEVVKGWLKLIPGVNKFFLEKEAKIKSDKILRIKKEKKGE
ncbi:MAG: hypothetical protein U5L76_00775 [Patescibacteria group bacterium]|nr:hypothetical protein [Patescibacteria group bacterium]